MSKPDYMDGQKNKAVVEGLQKVLADTFVLYFKTHSFHWNVEGPQFRALHELFEEQYTALWESTDGIAERIRALDDYAPNSWDEMFKNASLSMVGQTPDAEEMVRQLAEDNQKIVADTIYPALRSAEEAGDEATVDMYIERIEAHEEAAWMLRSMNKKAA